MAETAPSSRPLRERLALALDVPDLASARSLARVLAPWFAVVKVGLELYVAEGPAAVATFVEDGLDVFVDLKLHDIPTTVHRAARAIAHTGARYATVHAAGGAQPTRVVRRRRSGSPSPCSRAMPTRLPRSSSSAPHSRRGQASAASSARWRTCGRCAPPSPG